MGLFCKITSNTAMGFTYSVTYSQENTVTIFKLKKEKCILK